MVDLLILIILAIICSSIFIFLKSVKNASHCCGDCQLYKKCWNNSFIKDCYEHPACEKFYIKNQKN